MRLLALLLVLSVIGCQDGTDPDDYPVLPGGGGGGGFGDNPGADAAVDSVVGDGGVTARVCLLADARNLTGCATTGAAGFVVTLGGESAMTLDNGSFTIQVPTTSNLLWKVVSSADSVVIVPSLMQFDAVNLIPVLTAAIYSEMITTSVVTQAEDTASIIIALVDAQGDPVEDVDVTSTATEELTRYDDIGSSLVWPAGATGPAGLAWLTSVDPTLPVVSLSADPAPTGVDDNRTISVPVDQNAITFARFAF